MGEQGGLWDSLVWRLFVRLQSLSFRRPPDFIVGTRESPYLLRWWLIPRNPIFNIYLHCFCRSDDDRALHDHPWFSISLLLRGRYLEHTIDRGGVHQRRLCGAGDVRIRGAQFAHRLEIEPGHRVWTLFITGPVIREWGFHCEKGWVPHGDFTDTADNVSGIGRGCEAVSRRGRRFWHLWRRESA